MRITTMLLAQTTAEHFQKDPAGSLMGVVLGVIIFFWMLKFIYNLLFMYVDGANEITKYSKRRQKP